MERFVWKLSTGREMQGATGPGGLECQAKDSNCVLLTLEQPWRGLSGDGWVATSLMTFTHIEKSLLLEKANEGGRKRAREGAKRSGRGHGGEAGSNVTIEIKKVVIPTPPIPLDLWASGAEEELVPQRRPVCV